MCLAGGRARAAAACIPIPLLRAMAIARSTLAVLRRAGVPREELEFLQVLG